MRGRGLFVIMRGHSLFVALAVAAARADQSITPQLHELGASIDNEYLRFLDEDPLQSCMRQTAKRVRCIRATTCSYDRRRCHRRASSL